MMRRTLPSVLFLIWLCMGSAHGQDKPDPPTSVQGKVSKPLRDRLSPVHEAHVMLVNDIDGKKDTLYTTTDFNGFFTFVNIKPRPTFIKVSYVGLETVEGQYDLVPGRNLCYFTLKKTEELGPAKVTAEAPLMRRIGDTTVYNAGVVQTMDGESLRGLLEKLPGFQITKSGIKVDGEEVKRTYVNGILLFGDGVTTATDALYASEVSQVKVYDEQTPEGKVRGLQNSRQRVLDIVTKEAMMSFSDAGISVSGGCDDTGQARYTGVAGAMFYSELMSFEAAGALDNNNVSNLAGDDFSIMPFLFASSFGGGQSSSYQEQTIAKAYFSKFWDSRDFGSNLHVRYKFNHDYARDGSIRHEDHYLEDGSPGRSSRDTLSSGRNTDRHVVRVEFTLRNDPRKYLETTLYGAFDSGSASSLNIGNIASGADVFARNESVRNTQKGYDLSGTVNWTDYSIPAFKFVSLLSLSADKSTMPSERLDTLAESAVRMKLISDGCNTGTKARFSTSAEWVPVNKDSGTWQISGNFDILWDRRKNIRESMDMLSGMPVPYLSETYDYTFDVWQPTASLKTRYASRTLEIDAGVKTRWSLLACDERFPAGGKFEKIYPAVLPSFQLKWKKVRLSVDADQILPSVSQMRKRISDENPFFLTGGNPELKASYGLRTSVGWNKYFGNGQTSMAALFDQSLSWNALVSRTVYFTEDTTLDAWDGYEAPAGAMLYTFDNACTPASVSSLNLILTKLMFRRKLSTQLSILGSMARRPMYLGTEYLAPAEKSLSSSLTVRLVPDKHWTFLVVPELAWIHSTGGGQTLLSERMDLRLKSDVIFKYRILEGALSYTVSHIDYLSGAGIDLSRHVLNLSVGRSFFKKQWKVELKGLDLLNAGSVYSMILTPEAMTQTWTPTYGRRLMLTLSYRFRKAKS